MRLDFSEIRDDGTFPIREASPSGFEILHFERKTFKTVQARQGLKHAFFPTCFCRAGNAV
jgi:hypothetical protein